MVADDEDVEYVDNSQSLWLANFSEPSNAIEYAIKYVNDNVKLAIEDGGEIVYYDKEQAIKLMEEIKNEN